MFNEREKVVFRVLYFPFLTSSTKVSFGSQFDANANAYDANDRIKYLISLLQKWVVTSLPPLQESRPEILNRREKGRVLRS